MDYDDICNNCPKFIVTDQHPIEDVWREIGLVEAKDATDTSYKEFLLLFKRLVSFGSLGSQIDMSKIWTQIYGSDAPEIGAGYTPSGPSAANQPTFDEVMQMPHNAMKTLYFSDEQFGLLENSNCRLVVFLIDYGGGKNRL